MQLTMTSLIDQSTSVGAVSLLGHMDREARGAVYTRVEVVEFILDLVGYTDDVDLTACRILEPSCGSGLPLCLQHRYFLGNLT